MKSHLKFFIKMWLVSPLRAFLLSRRGAPVRKEGWDKRLLIVNLEGMGDLVFFTSVLKHYKKRYPEKEIWLLLKGGFGVEQFFAGKIVDKIETINYRKFATDPFYGLKFLNKLRRVGFETVINHDFCAAEILGKMLVLELGAKNVIGYEGMSIEWEKPFDVQQERNLKIVKEKLFPRFTKIIPAIKDPESKERLRSAIEHYIAIYEGVTGSKESEYATILPLRGEDDDTELDDLLKKFNLEKNKYVLFNVNTTTSYRSWPLFRFSKVAEFLDTKGITVVLMGSSAADIAVAGEFQKVYWPKAVNIAGKTSLRDLANLVYGSFFTFANDTSVVHFAIAIEKPSICIAGGGQFGCFANYGYSDINHWLWKKTACYFDDWHCHRGLPPGAPAPCVEAVPFSAALVKVESLVDYLEKNKSYPREKFSPNFPASMPGAYSETPYPASTPIFSAASHPSLLEIPQGIPSSGRTPFAQKSRHVATE
ncbi:MAG: glycosyltransferase family 9 protein, partial [Candidatus Liptonbacteria bacterium]|nr:glycosyltransferase family 9 protein [Candidatus Liptonbacteria bacterium]